MPTKKYGFNPGSLSYFSHVGDRQRSLPQSSIKLDVNRFALGVQTDLRNLTNQLLAGQIPAQAWYDESARLLKLSYRASVDVARGRNDGMTNEEKEKHIALVLLLLLLLNRAAEDINAGIFPMDGRLVAYIGSLGAANNGLYENWRLGQAINLGYREGRRLLSPADHCRDSHDRPGCVELAALGWVPIHQVVRLGDATCRQNCRCVIQYRGKPLFGNYLSVSSP